MKTYNLFLAMIACMLFSCKKEEKVSVENTPSLEFQFRHGADKDIHFDIYKTQEDFLNYKNVWRSGVTPAYKSGKPFSIPVSELEDGHTYYVDYYSDDHVYNNWYTRLWFYYVAPRTEEDKVKMQFTYKKDDTLRYEDYNLFPVKSYSFNTCIDKNKGFTSWKAIDARDRGKSVWNTMSPERQHRTVLFYPDFTCKYTYFDGNNIVTKNLKYGTELSIDYNINNGGATREEIREWIVLFDSTTYKACVIFDKYGGDGNMVMDEYGHVPDGIRADTLYLGGYVMIRDN